GSAKPAAPATPEEPASRVLFPVRRGGKWGYIDREARVAISPRFDRAERFSEGLAAVVLEGKHGYVDAKGELVLVPAQEPAGAVHRPFADGLAAVRDGEAIGFIDRKGKLAIPARFISADDFSEGLAFACDRDGCGYLDRSGRPALGGGLRAGYPVHGGFAGVALPTGHRGGKRWVLYHVARGRLPGDYDDVGRVSDGLIAVRHEGRWGYVDGEGRAVIPPQFARGGEFVDGLAPVWEAAWSCGYADRTGKLAIPTRFRVCHPFSEGRARVELLGDPKVPQPAFIDRSGAVVIEGAKAGPRFDAASDFAGGLAAVESRTPAGGTKLGYVDVGGKYVWPPAE
ncbi:MAG TPA: WG repeat-containing protein, partial [Anaeromyxobacteraceae bacterium]|nr:WG repeat-containing protein [Anaeromyxobacteraceae bacterium]